LSVLGTELIGVHLLETSCDSKGLRFKGTDWAVAAGYPKFLDERIYVNTESWFEGVDNAVWELEIGGYQICHKWLKDRRSRELTSADREHFTAIVAALRWTLTQTGRIDEVISEFGGFPLPGTVAGTGQEAVV
jgi:hypothetical protein